MKRLLIALPVGAVLAGATYGAAATLGGITTPDLGADDAAVESCDTTGVSTSYSTALDGSTFPGSIRVDSVTVGDVDTPSCDGQAITVILTHRTGPGTSEEIARATRTIPTPAPGPTTQSFPVPDPATPAWTDPAGTPVADPRARDVDDVHIQITG